MFNFGTLKPVGMYIADMAYEYPAYSKKYVTCAGLFMIKDGHFKIKFHRNPATDNIIGLFRDDSEAIIKAGIEAPFVEGDVVIKKRGCDPIKIGHIHSQQNEIGKTIYFMKVTDNTHFIDGDNTWCEIKE